MHRPHHQQEIIIFLFPLINFEKLKRMLFSVFTARKTHHQGDQANASASLDSEAQSQQPATQVCGLCNADPIPIPYKSDQCRHQFCYWCIKTSLMQADTGQVQCPACSAQITSISRVGPPDS